LIPIADLRTGKLKNPIYKGKKPKKKVERPTKKYRITKQKTTLYINRKVMIICWTRKEMAEYLGVTPEYVRRI
jgi:hypothetical protein